MECAWSCNSLHCYVGCSFYFFWLCLNWSRKKQKAVSSIEEFHKELSKNLNQITETLAALNQITKTREGDLYKPYNNFVKQLNRTTENSRNMSKHAEDMAIKGRRYFDTWEKALSRHHKFRIALKGRGTARGTKQDL